MKSRLTIPGRFMDLLFSDPDFFQEVSRLKKASVPNFPKYDQWFDESGLHLQFALAGYSPGDVGIKYSGSELIIESQGLEPPKVSEEVQVSDDGTEDVVRTPQVEIQQGMISRGIARRRFRLKFVVDSSLNLGKSEAVMEHGLLRITIPAYSNEEIEEVAILVK
jgi:HSP20 family molecular chaperone IbpA